MTTPAASLFHIPAIGDDLLARLAKRIKPVIRNRNNALVYIDACHLRNTAFTWSPRINRRATNLVKHATIETFHRYGYYGFFKPSVAEVLAQIPVGLIEKTVAFESIGPQNAKDLGKHTAALNAGFHVATTHLYGRSS